MRQVLVPYDGSEPAEEALRHALTGIGEAEVEVVYVIDPVGKGGDRSTKAAWWDMWYEDLEGRAEKLLDEAQEIAEDLGSSVDTAVRHGKPSDEIIEYASEEGFDGIVMGRQGETGLSRVLLGSVADNVSRHSDLPVTLVGETN